MEKQRNLDDRHVINIMTSCDNNLAKYVLPQIASIAQNLSRYRVNFYLFYTRIETDNRALIREYAATFANIHYAEIFIEDFAPYAELAKHGGSWAYEAYFALGCHQYLPENTERILCIDAGDVIIDGDIAEYYFGDFGGHSIIATSNKFVERSGDMVTTFEKGDMSDFEKLKAIKHGVFNSGSYVMNLTQFRANGLTIDDFLYVAQVLSERLPDEDPVYFGDQGLIAVALVGDIKYFAYPEIKNLWYMPYNFCLWFYEVYAKTPELWYTPKILHYAGVKFKPWQARFSPEKIREYEFQTDYKSIYAPFWMKGEQVEFYEIWWKYCAMTPIYEETNKVASAYASALETHYLPLRKSYNELVNSNIALQQQIQQMNNKKNEEIQ